MDYQLSVETDGIKKYRPFKFLLLEGNSTIRLDLELALRKRFPEAHLDRLFPVEKPNLTDINWSDYDLVLVDCPSFSPQDVSWLTSLRRIEHQQLLMVALVTDEEDGRQAVWSGADMYLPLDESHVEFAARLDNLLEVERMLRRYPLDLPKWHFLEVLHNNENAIIFLVENQQAEQAVIKRFKLDIGGIDKTAFSGFLHDAALLSSVQHSGLARLVEVGVSCDAVYVVMDYIRGDTLKILIHEREDVNLARLTHCFTQITEAIAVIHDLGLLHRDLKASNIMMTPERTPVLLDYGIEAKLLMESGFLSENEIYCTPYYVSPERIIGEPASIQSDLYALGILLFEMLTGDKPYMGGSLAEILQKQWFDPIPQLPAEYGRFQPLLDQLLAKLPEQRPASAHQVLEWLNHNA